MKNRYLFGMFFWGVIFCSCQQEDPAQQYFMGEWKLVSSEINNQVVDVPDSSLCFIQEGIMLLCGQKDTIRSGWNYENNILYISKHLPASYQVEHIDQHNMTISRLDFGQPDIIIQTRSTFLKQ